MAEERNFRRKELLEKYITKMLYRWGNGKFEEFGEKLVKMEVSFSRKKNLKKGIILELKMVDLTFFFFLFFYL